MIGLDTNVLVRFLTQDEPRQARIANAIIEERLSDDDPGFISIVVLMEFVWVLRSIYGYTDADIANAIQELLSREVLLLEHAEVVLPAAIALKEGSAEFQDALIAGLGRKAGCSTTLTFDKDASLLPGFRLAT